MLVLHIEYARNLPTTKNCIRISFARSHSFVFENWIVHMPPQFWVGDGGHSNDRPMD